MDSEVAQETMNDQLSTNKNNKMSQEDFQVLCGRADSLTVARPAWCPDFHHGLYKICYLLVKEDSSCVGMPAAKRTKLIMKLMNTHIDQARKVVYEKVLAKKIADKAALESVSDLKPQETTEVPHAEQNT